MPKVLCLAFIAIASWTLAGLQQARPAADRTPPPHPGGRYVTVNGARLWAESEGHGAPMILVAGGPGLQDLLHARSGSQVHRPPIQTELEMA